MSPEEERRSGRSSDRHALAVIRRKPHPPARVHAANGRKGYGQRRAGGIANGHVLLLALCLYELESRDIEDGDEDTEEKVKYQIVGDFEADVRKGKISIGSPIARALIGKKAGDSVEVNTPGGAKSYEILKVAFQGVKSPPA